MIKKTKKWKKIKTNESNDLEKKENKRNIIKVFIIILGTVIIYFLNINEEEKDDKIPKKKKE